MTNVWSLRQAVLDKQALGKVSPNSQVMKEYKAALPPLSPFLLLVAIGLMLGDVSLQANASRTAYRIKFEWGNLNKEYAHHIYDLFKVYCLTSPQPKVRRNHNGNDVTTWCFQTVTHPAFNVLANLFMLDKTLLKGINITALATVFGDVSLAYWFMDDGGQLSYTPGRYGLELNTQGFTQQEVQSLCQLLVDKYGFDSWVKEKNKQYRIAISGHSYHLFFKAVKPYIHESMKRKFPKGSRTSFDT